MWSFDGDGWRDESTEGPYIGDLKTFYFAKQQAEFIIVRLYNEIGFKLKKKVKNQIVLIGEFETIAIAKQKAHLLMSEGN